MFTDAKGIFGHHDAALEQNELNPHFARRGAFEVFTGHWSRPGASCRNWRLIWSSERLASSGFLLEGRRLGRDLADVY